MIYSSADFHCRQCGPAEKQMICMNKPVLPVIVCKEVKIDPFSISEDAKHSDVNFVAISCIFPMLGHLFFAMIFDSVSKNYNIFSGVAHH